MILEPDLRPDPGPSDLLKYVPFLKSLERTIVEAIMSAW